MARGRPVAGGRKRRAVRREQVSRLAAGGFLYVEIARELRRRVEQKIYLPGRRIPTEAELVREFDVSAITVRRAVRNLTAAGLLFGRQGLGVFVTDTRRIVRRFSTSPETSTADDIRAAGYEPALKERALSFIYAPPHLADRLGIAPGDRLYRHDKILFADNDPVAVDTTYLPSRIGDTVRHDLSSNFIFPVLAKHGLSIDHLDYRFEAAVVDDEEGAALGLPPGFPVLAVFYTAFAPDGSALMTGRTISRSDRFAYEFCGRRELHGSSSRNSLG